VDLRAKTCQALAGRLHAAWVLTGLLSTQANMKRSIAIVLALSALVAVQGVALRGKPSLFHSSLVPATLCMLTMDGMEMPQEACHLPAH
jgi:hypothetical protein